MFSTHQPVQYHHLSSTAINSFQAKEAQTTKIQHPQGNGVIDGQLQKSVETVVSVPQVTRRSSYSSI